MSDLTERICTECPARAANNCPYANFPHLKRKCEYRSDVMYGYELAEKDLALTWGDVQLLDYFVLELAREEKEGKDWGDGKEFYTEVLTRFKRFKEAKNQTSKDE